MMTRSERGFIGLMGLAAMAGTVLLGCSEIASSPASSAAAAPQRPGVRATSEASGVQAVTTVELHNVFRVRSGLFSGAAPESSAEFAELAGLGIKTLLSVDGATPDLKAARDRGMRYVHIPTTYAEVTREQQLEIARAVRDLPGPIYLHCHHGKHRGPAAAASAAVLLGEMTSEQGVAFMTEAGTAATYRGLYACVAMAMTATPTELDGAPTEFPPVKAPAGLTAAMVSVDRAYENLGLIRSADWKVPADHPDLVPASEAGQLADHLRFSGEDPTAKSWGTRFEAMLAKSIGEATALEEAMVAGRDSETMERLWRPMVASCKECHSAYRDLPGRYPPR